MTIEHKNIDDANLHEPKGVAGASSDQVYVADGLGSGTWKSPKQIIQQAIYDYNDLATATTPINLALANTQYELTNDGLGPDTNLTFKYTDIANLWNTTTNRFDFSNLSLGDTVDIRFDVEYTTPGANNAVLLDIELGVGGTPYQLPIITFTNFKAAGAYQQVVWYSIYMGDTNTLNNPARLLASSDTAGVDVKVNGWYIRPMRNVTAF